MKRFATPLFLLTLTLAVWGCTSARGAYDDAMQAELAGDLPTAFERYYTALRRDGDLPNARGRFGVVGRDLVSGLLTQASGARVPTQAADLYLDVERRVNRASEVGVSLRLPETFAEDRDLALADAIASLREASADAHAAGDFNGALASLNRARAYRPSASELRLLDGDARLVYSDWAEDDLARGLWRRAYANTEYALGFSDPDDDTVFRLQDLQAAILDAGSVRVAFFPLARDARGDDRDARGSDDGERGAVGRDRARMPYGFAADLDDVLNDDHWTRPPLFVYAADPADVRRLVRGERDLDRLADNRSLLAGLARDLDADLGAAFTLGLWRQAEEVRERDVRQASTRSGQPATYDYLRVRMSAGATVSYTVVDASTRAVVCQGEVEKDVRDTVTFHEFDGDWRDLAVSRDDRRYFTDDYRADVEAEMALDLQTQLANAVAERVYACVGQQVP